MSTLGLISQAYGGFAAEKEFEGTLADTASRAGEAAYTKSETARVLKDKDTKAIEWSALDPSKQAEWTGKFEPEQKEQKWYESLFGKEAEYKFGESDYFKQSSISASHALSEATSLEGLINAEDFKPKTMADDVGLSKESKMKAPDDQTVVEEVAIEEPKAITPKEAGKDEFQYKEGGEGVAGSEEWFGASLKDFRKRNLKPSFGGSLKKYNPQFQTLAKEQGWTPEKGWS